MPACFFMKTKIILLIAFIIISAAAIFSSGKIYAKFLEFKEKKILLEKKRQEWLSLKEAIEEKALHFNGTVGIAIKGLNTGWRIDFNEDILFPSASLVKVPIMLSCFYAAQEGKIGLKDIVILKSSDKVSGSKVLGDYPSGSQFTVEQLLGPMITQSDNSAANALITFLGFDTLNAYFKKMGLEETNIVRKMMDFQERKEGKENYTTAAEMAYLLEKIYRKEFLNKEVSERCMELLAGQKINDRIPRELPKNGLSVAHKTGLENYICHDVGIVFTQKGDFLICVLVKHGDKLANNAKKLISSIAFEMYNYYL